MTRACRQRRGVSLVETLVIITIGSVVMGAVATGTVTLLRVNSRLNTQANSRQQVEQIARVIRTDLHDAESASWDDASKHLRLQSPDADEIVYEFGDGRCTRRQADAALPYRLPAGVSLACPTAKANAPAVYEVRVTRAEAPDLTIAAGLGRSRRLLIERGSP